MNQHYKLAIWIATIAWILLITVPAGLLWAYPTDGLEIGRVAFFGCMLGAILWFQTIFTADAASGYGILDFSFLLSCTAMGAFVTLAGSSILVGQASSQSGGILLSVSLQLYFVGLLFSLASSLVAARALGANDQAGPGLRLLSIVLCTAVFVFYVFLMMIKSSH